MSAPDTDIHKQERDHRVSLSGIGLSLIVVAVLFVGWIAWLFIYGNDPGDETPDGVPAATAVETDDAPVATETLTVVD